MSARGEFQLLTSSMDRTLALWDLRRGTPELLQAIRGHTEGVAAFGLRGDVLLSAAGSKIGLSSVAAADTEGRVQRVHPLRVIHEASEQRMASPIAALAMLPFSRLYLLAGEDGSVHICG